jgi:ESCRT-I complex subunit VPS28
MYQPPTTRPLSYAPLQTHSTSLSSFHPHTTIPLDEELKAFSSPSERDLIDSLAELYSIIRTLDGLERAYQKDALSEAEYNEMCGKMLKQYRSLLSDDRVSERFGNLDAFMQEWEVCRMHNIFIARSGPGTPRQDSIYTY